MARRKRVVRGAAPARWATGLAAVVLVTALFPLLPQDSPVNVAVLLTALGAGVLAARAVRSLRTGSRRAAVLVLAAVALLLVCGLLVVDGASVSPDRGDEDGPLAFAAGAAAGFGRGLPTVAYDPWTGNVNVPVLFPATLFLAGVVHGSPGGLWLRGHQRALIRSRLIRSRLVRWPLLLLLSSSAIVCLALSVDLLADAFVPAEAFAVLALVPALVVASRAAVEVLGRRDSGDGLPPAWEPAAVRRRQLLTGRRLPLVLLLLTAAAGAVLLALLTSQLLRSSIEVLVDTWPAITPGTVDAVSILVWSVSVLLLLGGLQLHTLARRSAALDAAALRQADHGHQVLYLRSFGDDDLEVPTHRSPRHTLLDRMLYRRRERFEAMLTWHLWGYGPVVGVGRPRERLPQLGAAREYLSDEQWKEQVEGRIRDARAVVVVLGHTQGLGWELRAIRRLGAHGKTVLVVPPVSNDQLALRWRFFDEVMAECGWPLVPPDDRPGALTAVLRRASEQDRQDGTTGHDAWAVFAGRAPHEWQYELAVEAALGLVEPSTSAAVRARSAPARTETRAGGPGSRAPWPLGIAYAAGLVWVGSSGTGTTANVNELEAGACVAPLDIEVAESAPYLDNRMEVLACTEPHPYEVVANVPVGDAGGPFPGDDALERFAADECPAAARDHVGAPLDQTDLELAYQLPSRLSWALGDDDLLCVVADARGLLTTSVAGSAR